MKKKNIIEKLICALALTSICSFGYAQKGLHKVVGVAAEVALPLGDFGNAYGVGLGATGKAFYGVTEKGAITGTLGYLRFGMKEDSNTMSGSMGMIPIMFGYRHDFGGLYAEPQIGIMMLKSKVKFDDMGLGLAGMSGTHSTSKVSLGLGGGYVFGDWDLAARFQLVDNLNFIGVRIGYNFSF